MLKRNIMGMLDFIIDKVRPYPSGDRDPFAAELKAAFHDIPVESVATASLSDEAWSRNANRLRELVLSREPREFLQWDVIAATMFISNARFVSHELNYLRQQPAWRGLYKSAIRESASGRPIPYLFHPASSGNLIHHAYHAALFQEQSGVNIQDIDLVLEFGGGYGSMCRLFHNLGFNGRYLLFDLPAFSALQRYYLRSIGLDVASESDGAESLHGVFCISDINQLQSLLSVTSSSGPALFLSTWALSESPLKTREQVTGLLSGFRLFLIAYQESFRELDNMEYFDAWKRGRQDIAWHDRRIEHIPGNNYLFGTAVS